MCKNVSTSSTAVAFSGLCSKDGLALLVEASSGKKAQI